MGHSYTAAAQGGLVVSQFERVRYLWPDHLGLARGKYLPYEHAGNGGNHCVSTFALQLNREMIPHEQAAVLTGLPDLEADFELDDVRPGWERGTGVVVADIARQGAPLELAPRSILRRVIGEWQELGLAAKVGVELEAYLLVPDGDGWKPIHTPGSHVYGTGPLQDPTGTIDEIMQVANAIGMPLESVNSEYDDGQFEMTLHYTDALTAADDAFLFKQMAREIASTRGVLLTFLGKPHNGRGGNGLHVNFSLVDESGVTVLGDPDSADGLSMTARHCIGGLVEKHRAMAALLAPNVNSYKRLQPGQLAGCWANWGYDHRGTTVRIPPARGPATRIEHRMSDCAVSPHLAIAVVLTAALLGVRRGIEPPPAETLDCLENVSTDVKVPDDLGAALDALAADQDFIEAFSPAFVEGFLAVKRAEWDRFNRWTTDWELNEYLPYY